MKPQYWNRDPMETDRTGAGVSSKVRIRVCQDLFLHGSAEQTGSFWDRLANKALTLNSIKNLIAMAILHKF